MIKINHCTLIFLLLLCTTFTGCTFQSINLEDGPPLYEVNVDNIPDAVPKPEKFSKSVNPLFYHVKGIRYYVKPHAKGYQETGIASWYGRKFHGRPTSTGEIYDMLAMTAAHRELPIPTYLRVTNLENNRKIIVRTNDRGPFKHNRIIDLSYAAAKKLDIVTKGTGLVKIEAISAVPHLRPTQSQIKNIEIQSKRKIYLLLATFEKLTNAKNFSAKIKQMFNHPIETRPESNNKKINYKVIIGPFKTIADCDRIFQKIIGAGFGEPKIFIT